MNYAIWRICVCVRARAHINWCGMWHAILIAFWIISHRILLSLSLALHHALAQHSIHLSWTMAVFARDSLPAAATTVAIGHRTHVIRFVATMKIMCAHNLFANEEMSVHRALKSSLANGRMWSNWREMGAETAERCGAGGNIFSSPDDPRYTFTHIKYMYARRRTHTLEATLLYYCVPYAITIVAQNKRTRLLFAA